MSKAKSRCTFCGAFTLTCINSNPSEDQSRGATSRETKTVPFLFDYKPLHKNVDPILCSDFRVAIALSLRMQRNFPSTLTMGGGSDHPENWPPSLIASPTTKLLLDMKHD